MCKVFETVNNCRLRQKVGYNYLHFVGTATEMPGRQGQLEHRGLVVNTLSGHSASRLRYHTGARPQGLPVRRALP